MSYSVASHLQQKFLTFTKNPLNVIVIAWINIIVLPISFSFNKSACNKFVVCTNIAWSLNGDIELAINIESAINSVKVKFFESII